MLKKKKKIPQVQEEHIQLSSLKQSCAFYSEKSIYIKDNQI